jgi:hypothetical protein
MRPTFHCFNRHHTGFGLLALAATLLSSCDGSAGAPLCPEEAAARERLSQIRAQLIRLRMGGPYVAAKIGPPPDYEPDPVAARAMVELRLAIAEEATASRRCSADQLQESGP